MYNKALKSEDIKWMSHGCGKGVLLGLLLPWSKFITGVVGKVKVEKPALCADPEGDVRTASNRGHIP